LKNKVNYLYCKWFFYLLKIFYIMKTKTFWLIALLAIGCLTLAGCNKTENPDENVGIANPASVYCEDQWGTVQIETAGDGSQYGICMFSDGTYCEEWSYYRDECQAGEIYYNTLDEGFIDDVEIKTDWNGSSEKYSDEDLQAAVDKIVSYFDVKVEFQQIFYQWDEESANQLSYCQELNPEVDECVFFKTNFYIPEQDAEMAGAFEPNTTLTDYEWYLWRSNGGEWDVLTAGY